MLTYVESIAVACPAGIGGVFVAGFDQQVPQRMRGS